MVAPSHQDMETPRHTIRCTAIQPTSRGMGPAVFGAAAVAGAAITGTATVGTVDGTADMKAGADMAAEDMAAEDMEAADMGEEADMAAAADTFPWTYCPGFELSGQRRCG